MADDEISADVTQRERKRAKTASSIDDESGEKRPEESKKHQRKHHVKELKNGVKMPMVGLGTWKSDEGLVEEAVVFAVEHAGYRHIDCARFHENEEQVGHSLKKIFDHGKVKREQLFISSKLWNHSHHPSQVKPALESTLAALQIDYLDLYLIHSPVSYVFTTENEMFPKDELGLIRFSEDGFLETWKKMEEMVEEGLCKSIGLCNFNKQQIEQVLQVAKIHRPVVLQIENHPFLTQEPLVEFCESNDIAVVAFGPLGSPGGGLTGQDPSLLDHPKVVAIAKQHARTPAQVLLRYQLQRDIAVIPKTVSKERLKENIHLYDFSLTERDVAVLSSLNRNWRFCPCTALRDCNGDLQDADELSPFHPWKDESTP